MVSHHCVAPFKLSSCMYICNEQLYGDAMLIALLVRHLCFDKLHRDHRGYNFTTWLRDHDVSNHKCCNQIHSCLHKHLIHNSMVNIVMTSFQWKQHGMRCGHRPVRQGVILLILLWSMSQWQDSFKWCSTVTLHVLWSACILQRMLCSTVMGLALWGHCHVNIWYFEPHITNIICITYFNCMG